MTKQIALIASQADIKNCPVAKLVTAVTRNKDPTLKKPMPYLLRLPTSIISNPADEYRDNSLDSDYVQSRR